jgi:hypothetical protein
MWKDPVETALEPLAAQLPWRLAPLTTKAKAKEKIPREHGKDDTEKAKKGDDKRKGRKRQKWQRSQTERQGQKGQKQQQGQ